MTSIRMMEGTMTPLTDLVVMGGAGVREGRMRRRGTRTRRQEHWEGGSVMVALVASMSTAMSCWSYTTATTMRGQEGRKTDSWARVNVRERWVCFAAHSASGSLRAWKPG